MSRFSKIWGFWALNSGRISRMESGGSSKRIGGDFLFDYRGFSLGHFFKQKSAASPQKFEKIKKGDNAIIQRL